VFVWDAVLYKIEFGAKGKMKLMSK